MSVKQFQACLATLALEFDADVQGTVPVGGVQVRRDPDILDALLGTGVEVAVTGYAAVTEEVLVLQVSTVAPAEYLKGDEVLLPGDEVFCYVELGLQLAVLAVSDKLAVHPEIDVGGDGAEVEEDVLPGPGGRDFEFPAVRADVVVLRGDAGRVALELAAPGVSGVHVDGIAEAVELPHPRDRHVGPALVVEADGPEPGGAEVGVGDPVELPVPIDGQVVRGRFGTSGEGEALILVSEIMGMHRRTVHGVHPGVLPFAEGLRMDGRRQGEGCKEENEFSSHRIGIGLCNMRYLNSRCAKRVRYTRQLRQMWPPSDS